MADIIAGDKYKRKIRLAMWWLRRELGEGKDRSQIHEDMEACGNPILYELNQFFQNNGSLIRQEYQKAAITDGMELILWAVSHDTAYRDPFFYMLKKLFDKKEELMPLIMKYYKEPEDWYVNAWKKSKENTEEMRKKGKINKFALSHDEKFWVPQHQEKEMNRIIEEEKQRRGW